MDTRKLSGTFVQLADSLVDDYDVCDLLQVLVEGCVDQLGVSAAGLLIADEQARLHVAASSDERARRLDLYQLQNEEGPCLECLRSGQPVAVVVNDQGRWPGFATAAVGNGIASVLALPLQLRGQVIGALNLFGDRDVTLTAPKVPVAQAMADVCTIAILQERIARQRGVLNEQLQHALDSRVVIEQAKGVLSARLGVDPDEAFELMRRRSRDTRRPLSELAHEVTNSRTDDGWKQFQRGDQRRSM